MRKIMLGLTALALGALAVPTAGSAASNHTTTGGQVSASRGGATVNGGARVQSNINTGVRGSQNFAVNRNVTTNSAQTWNGQRWASDGRHHHRHDRDDFRLFGFVPFAAYGDYATYDDCWQTVWTPAGFQRVYVCAQDYTY
ncbi:MAG TPA: hypothetical protein VEH75_03160 [Xanthobacteraceae bacterium]|nr:hypothetical protein [Xanthobacteraceae bacterium]